MNGYVQSNGPTGVSVGLRLVHTINFKEIWLIIEKKKKLQMVTANSRTVADSRLVKLLVDILFLYFVFSINIAMLIGNH